MKKTFFGLFFLLIFSLSSEAGFSKELKIGYVNTIKVFNEYEKTKDYEKLLETEKDKKEKEISAKKDEIKKMQDKLSLLKEDKQEEERKKISEKIKEYRQLQNEALISLKKQRDTKMKEILEDIEAVIKEYAKEKSFDIIFSEGALLYGKKSFDITDVILKEVNKKYRQKK